MYKGCFGEIECPLTGMVESNERSTSTLASTRTLAEAAILRRNLDAGDLVAEAEIIPREPTIKYERVLLLFGFVR